MKKLLLIANVSKEHIRKFHIPFIMRMKQEGWRVDVACRLDEQIPECDKAYGLPCNRNPFDGGLIESIKLLKNIIKSNDYDVVHCNTITGSLVARIAAKSFRRKGLKVFYTNHGLHFYEGASLSRWLIGYPMEKMLAPYTDLFIAINSADLQMAKKHLSSCHNFERIHGIGVDLKRFRECSLSFSQRNNLRKEIGLSENDYVMTYVAELNQNKNQQVLLEALKLVRESIPEVKLMLVGPDHEEGRLMKCAQEMGLENNVLFLGWRNDIPELLSISDIYLASSKSEGLGLNLIEAMACNLPIIACKNRGHCEIINDGKNGFLVEQNDYKEMAKRVLDIYRDSELRNKLIHQAQEDISQYEISHVLDELLEIYRKYC